MKLYRENNEEWLNTLKDSMQEHIVTPPHNGWSNVSSSLAKRGLRRRILTIASSVSAAAAIALIFLFVPFSRSSVETLDSNNIAVVERVDRADEAEIVIEEAREITIIKERKVNKNQKIESLIAQKESLQNESAQEQSVQEQSVQEQSVQKQSVQKQTNQEQSIEKQIELVESGSLVSSVDSITIATNNESDTPAPNNESAPINSNNTSSTLTWEEYLANDNSEKKRGLFSGSVKNLLAVQVGNGGFNSMNPNVSTSSQSSNTTTSSIVQSGSISAKVISGKYNNIEQPYSLNSVSSLNSYASEDQSIYGGTQSVSKVYNHRQPISFSIMMGKELNKKFTVESGIVYTLLLSDLSGYYTDRDVKQELHYIGIPLRFNWNFVNIPYFMAYAGVGGIIERSIYARLDSKRLDINSLTVAAGVSVGAQYNFFENIGVYIEPSVLYYFNFGEKDYIDITSGGLKIKSVRSEYPLGFTFNAGFRFSF